MDSAPRSFSRRFPPPQGTTKNSSKDVNRSDATLHAQQPPDTPKHDENLPRSASYTSISPHHDRGEGSFSFSEDDLIPSRSAWSNFSQDDMHAPRSPTQTASSSNSLYSRSSENPTESKITVSRALLISERESQNPPSEGHAIASTQPAIPAQRSNSLSRTFTNFSRKPKLTRSNSHSPEKVASGTKRKDSVKGAEKERDGDTNNSGLSMKEHSKRKSATGSDNDKSAERNKANEASPSRRRSLLARRSSKGGTVGSMLKFTGSDTPQEPPSPKKRPVAPLLKSFSNTSLPSFPNAQKDGPEVPPVPDSLPNDKFRPEGGNSSKKKDELWTAFRVLDGDFHKFQSKSTALKANVVRNSLLPFLRTYGAHPSNKRLRPEDLDRRVMILNKWWTGMLELVNGRHNQSISGTDRPVILDGIAGIMERAEWRHTPSSFCPIAERQSTFDVSRSASKASLASASSDFILESVHHNVRNTFVQNLFTQVVYAVDKMSQRHAPASLVTFCGKSCAYAFFFCPGVADILMRQWDIKPNDMRRVLRSCGYEKSANINGTSEMIAPNFPHCLQRLAFISLKDVTHRLKAPPSVPMGVDRIQWHGHWLSRWSGKDSDLFYVFVKHFHILTLDFLPSRPSKGERLSAPGMVMVHSQILVNLESTLHRQSNQAAAAAELAADTSITFDDLLGGEGSPSALPAFRANDSRQMAENRLIMLLRDLLADRDTPYPPVALCFAESFCDLLQTATESISVYDQSTCFTLCDFLQEAFGILGRFQRKQSSELWPLDWKFWLAVFKSMTTSHNTTTLIRLYALLFTNWGTITAIEAWKWQLCYDFLLEKDHFAHTFSHWCPMVRAYFMRLLCWRMARYDGEASDNEVLILKTLLQRLRLVWSHFAYLRDVGKNAPSTAPCNPAPGRKLLILRTDSPMSSSLISFNNMVPSISPDDLPSPRSQSQSKSSETSSSAPASFLEKVTASLEQSSEAAKKKGGLFRSLLTYRGSENRSRSQSPTSRDSSTKSSPPESTNSSRGNSPDRASGVRSSMYERRPTQPPPKSGEEQSETPQKRTPTPQAFFKFSLEFVDRRPHALPTDMSIEPPRLPMAAQLLLSSQIDLSLEPRPRKPTRSAANAAKYTGRALAEWTLVVNECQNFFERRRNEGVASNRLVETPILGVESFRRPG